MPWVFINGTSPVPTPDFKSRTPALDNSEFFWAALAVSHAWKTKHPDMSPGIRQKWDNVTWKMMLKNAKKIFFNETTKKIRAVASIKNLSLYPDQNTYTNDDDYYLDDPYEG